MFETLTLHFCTGFKPAAFSIKGHLGFKSGLKSAREIFDLQVSNNYGP